MATAGNTQFRISMLFTGRDQLSPELKKMSKEVKDLKQQANNLGSGGGGFKFLDSLSKGLKDASKYLDDIQGKLDKMKASGFGNMLAGGAMVAPVMKALDSAGEMQLKMTTISGATGVLNTTDIQKAIREASNVTKYSTAEVADLAVKLATSGMSGDQVKSLIPIMSKFAEVQDFGKHSAPEEAVTQAISSAHMLGIYDPKQLDEYLDKFNKATFMTPGNTTEFFDTFKYLAPTAKGMGMTNEDVLYTSALANRVGFLGSMGGTESADMILRSIPGIFGGEGHVGKDGTFKAGKQLEAMIDLGLAKQNGSSVFFNNSGQFLGIKNFIDQLGEHSKGVNPEQLMKDYKNMFGMQGERLAVILGERGAEQLEIIKNQMDNMKSITQLQEDYNHNYKGQLDQFKTNLQNLNQDVGGALLPTATHLLNVMQPYVTNASKWVQTHQDEVEKIAKVSFELGAFLLVLGAGKIVIGTIGSMVIEPLKLAVKGFASVVDVFKKDSAVKKALPEQSIQANIVNVYGKTVGGGPGGGSGGISVGGAGAAGAEAKQLSRAGKALRAGGMVLKGAGSRFGAILPIALAFGAYDVMTAPEGHKVESAIKETGSTLGGWAGAEAGMAMGAGIGTFFGGPVGAAIGAGIGGLLGGFAGSAMGQKLAESAKSWFDIHFGNATDPKLKPQDKEPWKLKLNNLPPVPGPAWVPEGSSTFQTPDMSKWIQRQNEAQQKSAPKQNVSYSDNSTNNYNITAPDAHEVSRQIDEKRGNHNRAMQFIINSN